MHYSELYGFWNYVFCWIALFYELSIVHFPGEGARFLFWVDVSEEFNTVFCNVTSDWPRSKWWYMDWKLQENAILTSKGKKGKSAAKLVRKRVRFSYELRVKTLVTDVQPISFNGSQL